MTTYELMLDLLRHAAAAHGIHEKEDLGGVFDQQWPEWYAAHMVAALDERGLQIVDKA